MRTPVAENTKRALVVIASLPVAFGLWLFSFFALPAGSPMLLLSLVPPALVVWAVARSQFRQAEEDGDDRDAGPTVAVLPLVFAPVLALGTWAALLVLGVMLGIVPFMMLPDVPHSLVEEWEVGSALAGLTSVVAWWWLLSRRTRSRDAR